MSTKKKKATITLDTSDPVIGDTGSLAPPINPFAAQPSTGLDSMRLNAPAVSRPTDLAPPPTLNLATREQTSRAQSAPVMGIAAPLAAGLNAGAQVQPTTDAGSAVLQTATAGLGGAASGALAGAAIGAAGGPIGALGGAAIGGLTSLVSSGIQSFLGLKDARAAKRAQDKQAAYVKSWNENERKYNREQDAQHRSDGMEQTRYNRRQNALNSQWKAFQSTIDILNQGIRDDDNIRAMFVKEAR